MEYSLDQQPHIYIRLTVLCQGLLSELVPERQNHLDFTEARDSEWQWHQLGHIQVCTSLQTDNHASTAPQAGCPSCHQTNSVKALKVKPTSSTTLPQDPPQ